MAKSELGAKRVDPETGRKFYDLDRVPVVSPYTGKSYPLSFFEADLKTEEEEEPDVEETETEAEGEGAEIVSLQDAEEEDIGDGPPADPNVDDNSDDDAAGFDDDSDEGDTFLTPDEDDDDEDVSGIVKVESDDDDS